MSLTSIRVIKHALDFGAVSVLSLNRPTVKNAMSRQMLDEFSNYISSLYVSEPDVRALVLSSTSPDIFCAGADLKERKTFTPSDTKEFLIKFNDTLTNLQNLPIPTISAIQGLALGGGLEIALGTDLRVFGTNSKVGLPETRLAIIPGAGGTHRLPKLIGYSRAMDLILTGRRVSAQEALEFGICNRVADNAEEAAVDLAKQICEGGPLAIPAAKQAIKGATREWEQSTYKTIIESADKYEALKAFAEKRKPKFEGK